MMKIHKSALVPYSAQQMFDLVADVESYPQFLPGCTGARIAQRSEHEITASVDLAKAGVRQSFTTRNRMHPHERIDMHLVDGPFKRLHGHWSFDPVGTNGRGSKVALHLEFEFSNRLLAMTFGKAFQSIANTMIDAFCARAAQLYGHGA
ncbi:MAG: type II toxin-antitoxin system RatA family toxin [Gammaproteobacteria bacterium]